MKRERAATATTYVPQQQYQQEQQPVQLTNLGQAPAAVPPAVGSGMPGAPPVAGAAPAPGAPPSAIPVAQPLPAVNPAFARPKGWDQVMPTQNYCGTWIPTDYSSMRDEPHSACTQMYLYDPIGVSLSVEIQIYSNCTHSA